MADYSGRLRQAQTKVQTSEQQVDRDKTRAGKENRKLGDGTKKLNFVNGFKPPWWAVRNRKKETNMRIPSTVKECDSFLYRAVEMKDVHGGGGARSHIDVPTNIHLSPEHIDNAKHQTGTLLMADTTDNRPTECTVAGYVQGDKNEEVHNCWDMCHLAKGRDVLEKDNFMCHIITFTACDVDNKTLGSIMDTEMEIKNEADVERLISIKTDPDIETGVKLDVESRCDPEKLFASGLYQDQPENSELYGNQMIGGSGSSPRVCFGAGDQRGAFASTTKKQGPQQSLTIEMTPFAERCPLGRSSQDSVHSAPGPLRATLSEPLCASDFKSEWNSLTPHSHVIDDHYKSYSIQYNSSPLQHPPRARAVSSSSLTRPLRLSPTTAVAKVATTAGQKRHCTTSQSTGRRRVIRLLLALVISFSLCTLPNHVRQLCKLWYKPTYVSTFDLYIVPITTLVLYASSCLNPFLYALISHKFRNAYVEIDWCFVRKIRSGGLRNLSWN